MVSAKQLSREWRTGTGATLRRRRGIVGLSLVASGSMSLIAAYQTGLIKHLPEPPLRFFNADKVDASPEAYEKLSTPDAILGLGSYAMTMTLATMGGRDRAAWLDLALAGKVAFDVANAAKLTIDQWTKQRAFCFWCLVAAGATFAMAPLVVPEALAAFRSLTSRASRGSLGHAQDAIDAGSGNERDEEAGGSLRRPARLRAVPVRP